MVDKFATTDPAFIFSLKLVDDKDISVGLGLYLLINISLLFLSPIICVKPAI